ncbi:GTPase Era [Desulfoluna spongiiphila]|uniref:GTPase Era n=1 Tax=Desulfoluna spongiiphila TaxID=419481 RepID=A0A1G5I1Z4_9BACT|nr:GTPase Era [Desulfoluna spongiiphila]SCY70047.1 GTP-binding protein Era [Desulfoluna spongiiphila]VVS92650.1 gtp-binding protein era [Desulfoluna spongiiphila]
MENTHDFNGFKSGFVALVGAPNAGKSTLMNKLLGEKLSITSRKPQTTRHRILGVVHREDMQLVFVDTPGVHKSNRALNVRMVDVALTALGDVDVVVFMTDVHESDDESDAYLMGQLKKVNRPVILALNKVDRIKKPEVLAHIEKWRGIHDFHSIIPLSAKHGDQVDSLLSEISKIMPEGPPFYPEDVITDLPERFFVAEMVREKIFRLTGQEIPYSTAVTVDTFTREKKLVHVEATIHVERDSQKGIIIGKKGTKLKAIGEEARKAMEEMVGKKVFLKLFVRVEKNWSTDTKAIRRLGI